MAEIGSALGALIFLGSVVLVLIMGVEQIAKHLFSAVEKNGRKLPYWVKVIVPWVLAGLVVFALRLDFIGLALAYIISLTSLSLGWADVLGQFWFGVITLFISALFTGLGSNGFHEWWKLFVRVPSDKAKWQI